MKNICALTAVFILAAAGDAAAQRIVAPPAPGSILAVPPRKAPVEAPQVQKDLGIPGAAIAGADIRGVRISGAKVFAPERIAAAFSGLSGKAASAQALQAALSKVEKDYADAGYALGRAYIPAQKMQDGILTIRVLEGYVGAVTIDTDTPRVKDTIAPYAARLMAQRPLRTETLDRYLRLIAEIPGLSVTAKLTRMDLQTGAAAIHIAVIYKPITASLAVDTRSGLRGLPVQPYLTVKANNLLGMDDQLAVTTLLSPAPKQDYFVQAAGSAAAGSDGWRVSALANVARARANGLPSSLDLSSAQLHGEIGASYPLIKSADEQLTVAGGAGFSQLRYVLNRVAIAHDRDIAGWLEFSDTKTFSDHWSGAVTARGTFGVLLPYVPPVPASRANAARNFAKLDVSAAAAYAIDANWSVLLRADGQAATGSLLAVHEVNYGADRFGRGYDRGILSGDRGLGISLQPQYRFTAAPGWGMSVYVFGDHARVFNSQGDRQGDQSLSSAGAGLTVSRGDYGATLGVAQPLQDVPGFRLRLTPRLFGTLSLKI